MFESIIVVVVKDIVIGVAGVGFNSRASQIGHSVYCLQINRLCCDVFLELCCPSTKSEK